MKDLTGQKFGILTVTGFAEKKPRRTSGQWRYFWHCSCECGGTSVVNGDALKEGNTTSCGCLKGRKTHKESRKGQRTAEYQAWQGMKSRCLPDCRESKKYFDRGIRVCERWINSFENFLEDMGRRPSPKHTLDRIDNNGPYAPENCRWATWGQQLRNTRRTRFLTHNGETLCIKDWSEKTGIHKGTIRFRIVELGWSTSDALTKHPMTEVEILKLGPKARRPSNSGPQ